MVTKVERMSNMSYAAIKAIHDGAKGYQQWEISSQASLFVYILKIMLHTVLKRKV